jgi:hypothetical protein
VVRAAIGQGGAVTDLLVERARRGDPDAFVALIEERQVAMARVATAILGNEADVADVLQEALVAMWREVAAASERRKIPSLGRHDPRQRVPPRVAATVPGARATGPAERRSDWTWR